ncbi:hypothetical protein ACIRF8_12870 [Streptomyces sp. NPDC102406]|uniref:hypothetical protein n=1 Tax=Streptomyces sp. NPDC102406 TaxID=3366171 RepID=UPI0038171FDC
MNTDDPAPADPDEGPAPDTSQYDRQRSPRGSFERSMTTVQRDARAAELRAQRLTYAQIGEQLGIDKGSAWRAVQNARADVARPAVEKLIAAESGQLDDLYVMALEIIERNHVTVSHGKVVTMAGEDDKEMPLLDDGPRLQAIQTALKVRESYRKLHGLDAEQKVSVSGAVRYEVVGVDPADLT